jgi:hypothetical protein
MNELINKADAINTVNPQHGRLDKNSAKKGRA